MTEKHNSSVLAMELRLSYTNPSLCEGDAWGFCCEFRIRSIFYLSTLRLKQNGGHFADNIFKCIFLNENVWILIYISLRFVPKGPINNIPVLVWIMVWCCPGNKPLSEPTMVSLRTHICITHPQSVNYEGTVCQMLLCRTISSWDRTWPGELWYHVQCSPG